MFQSCVANSVPETLFRTFETPFRVEGGKKMLLVIQALQEDVSALLDGAIFVPVINDRTVVAVVVVVSLFHESAKNAPMPMFHESAKNVPDTHSQAQACTVGQPLLLLLSQTLRRRPVVVNGRGNQSATFVPVTDV
jgi:hypothetical protein